MRHNVGRKRQVCVLSHQGSRQFMGELKASVQPSQMKFKEQQGLKYFHKSRGFKLPATVGLQLGSNDRLVFLIQGRLCEM